ncbi:MAG: TAXI family TRAP transporter solute-binding subunit [Leptolyngbyaceae cyanobacterium RU_5_1]|nr:TAXI family TRAP transporter solute-binding subunit [Leptolyngbyaceae cyanobacterium RU_5_1]
MLELKRIATGLLLLFTLGSCSTQSGSITLSSGTTGGYYDHLGQRIADVSRDEVGLTIQHHQSQGSQENLQRLLDRKADFAIVQLDVASEAMRKGRVHAVAILATEQLHIITYGNSPIRSFADLEGKRVSVGAIGSDIRHSASKLIESAKLTIQEDHSELHEAFSKLNRRQVDAMIFVDSIGANKELQQQFTANPDLRFVPIHPSLINYLMIQEPGSYQPAAISAGTYNPRPTIPPQTVPTLSTATVIVTHPEVSQQKVGLLTWAILANARKFSHFYPELQTGDAQSLLQKGLFYIHAAAQEVFNEGDPRSAWIRYFKENSDLQSGLVILIGTSGLGLLLRNWRSERSKKLISTTLERINELQEILPQDAHAAMRGVDELSQELRVMFIDGRVKPDVYQEIHQKIHLFAEQCRGLLEQQRKSLVMDTLLLLDDWQATLQTDPAEALMKLNQLKSHYRGMLLTDQVDIEAYIELMELTLMSLMTLTPKHPSAGLMWQWHK